MGQRAADNNRLFRAERPRPRHVSGKTVAGRVHEERATGTVVVEGQRDGQLTPLQGSSNTERWLERTRMHDGG